VNEARIERDWRDLVENGVVAAAFADADTAAAWREALRARARRLNRPLRTGEGHTTLTWWAALTDWEDVVPPAVRLAKLRNAFAWLALHPSGDEPADP
jgi:hypothetical protein